MTNRTVQFWGQGYSTPPAEGVAFTPCTITATVDGNVVFSGDIPTLEASDILREPYDQQVLFTCEIPLVTTGNVYTLPVSLDITGEDIYLEQVLINYCNQGNSVSSGAAGFCAVNPNEARTNVVVTNATFVSAPPPDPRPAGTEGTWGWEVEMTPGQTCTFAFDLNISPGLE